MTDRLEVAEAIWITLARFDLDAYADGVMDTLDTVIEWDEEER